mgnify:CR=1 FL=1|jgi:hypothetical protein
MEINGNAYTLFDLGRSSEYLSLGDLLPYVEEINNRNGLISDFENAVQNVNEFKTKSFNSIFEFRNFRILIYCIIRATSPKTVIETGVLHGMTSAFMLEALSRNESGNLYSIDLPSYPNQGPANKDGFDAVLPPGKEPGWMVPERLKSRWELIIGKSLEKLPDLISKVKTVDLFLHDSEHTYDTMWKEMGYAWEALSDKGVLICDNVDNNTSFFDFCNKTQKFPVMFGGQGNEIASKIRFGIISK